MQAFLEKINKNRKILFFVFFISFFPAVGFAGWGDDILIGLGNLILMVVGYVLKMSAMVFDNMLAITMSTELFNTGFVKVAWSNIRDIANIAFILGAIMIAFSMMLDHGDWKKSLVKLIVIIFALNFSLFFARIIVDAGNITASVFLKSMSIKLNDPNHFIAAKSFYKNGENMEFHSVATPFVAALKIEKLVGVPNFKKFKEEVSDDGFGGTYFFLMVVVAFVTFALAKHLFVGSFMFLSRMVWIIYYMVSAPIFFVSYFIPGQENTLKKEWLFPLLGKSFGVVVYLFFIWLALMLLSSGNVNDIDASSFLNSPKSKEDDISNGIAIVLTIFVIKGVFIILVLKQANKIGTDMLENGKGILSKYAEKAWGAGAGVLKTAATLPFVGVGMAGAKMGSSVLRTGIGRTGARIYNSDMLKNWQSNENSKFAQWTGRQLRSAGKGIAKTKIMGIDYKTDHEKRQKARADLRHGLTSEQKERMDRKEIGEIRHTDIEGFANPEKNKTFSGYLDKESLMLYNRAKETQKEKEIATLSDKEKEKIEKGKVTLENILEEKSRKEIEKTADVYGLKDDARTEYIEKQIENRKQIRVDKVDHEYSRNKKEWDKKSQEKKNQELEEYKKTHKNYDEKQVQFAVNKREEMVRKSKVADFALKENFIKNKQGLMGRLLRRTVSSVSSDVDRLEENEETKRVNIKQEEKKEKENELLRKYRSEATTEKNEINEKMAEVEKNIKFSKNHSEFEKSIENLGVSGTESGQKLEEIYGKLSELVSVEKEVERIKNLESLEGKNWKSSDMKKEQKDYLERSIISADISKGEKESFLKRLKNDEIITGDEIKNIKKNIEKKLPKEYIKNREELKKNKDLTKRIEREIKDLELQMNSTSNDAEKRDISLKIKNIGDRKNEINDFNEELENSLKKQKENYDKQISSSRKEYESELKTTINSIDKKLKSNIEADLEFNLAKVKSEIDIITEDMDAARAAQVASSQFESYSTASGAAGHSPNV